METLQNSFDKYFGAYGIALVILAVGIVAVWVYNLKKDKKIEEKDVIIKDIVDKHVVNIKDLNENNAETIKCLNKENVENIREIINQIRERNIEERGDRLALLNKYDGTLTNVANALTNNATALQGLKTVIEHQNRT